MSQIKDLSIESSWKEHLREEFGSDYFKSLNQFLMQEDEKYSIYPPRPLVFAAFDHTPFSRVKVVILGQDPYHGPGQANGLCFSVSDGLRKPPSLVNIFKELHSDTGASIPQGGNLEKWAKQGVLLLNATLTVRANQAGSHQKKGWEIFTDRVIGLLSEKRTGLVFLLWGNYARAKEELIDTSKHHVLTAPHPSPFSANRGFFGCRHFSRANEILKSQGVAEVDWSL
ncbi:uracil-DNA glycosylase [Chitinispirillales bacterium ANBcel5]|uniref:uracil-DNA glycosylase n=1 Tax=Cellulosispirillum alkaliphilum TaxID=3039283 RepID=UPI002A54758A|nr:uracil-DNA glycosylase [Chitinispirillales bacterium ANBcel5]